MTKYVKKHFLLSTVLFSLLLISCLYSFLSTPVYAAEPDIQDKTMAILNDVIGINTEEYATRLNSQFDSQYFSLPQKEVDINLASYDGGLRVSCSFVSNNLRRIYLSDFEGKFSVEQSAADTGEMAKVLLERYQNYVGDSFYGELASMLDDVDVAKNITKSAGNIRFEVNNFDQTIVDFVWRYTDENGIVARSKSVSLSYDRGQLKGFSNNWPFYKVAGTPKISGEEATAIAIEACKNYSYEVSTENGTLTVTGFEIASESLGHEVLSYLNNPNQSLARGGDPFTLYPSWYVPIGFNQSYPGSVTGITVTIWADTGEISSTNKMVVNFASATSADEEESTISTDEQAITDGFDQASTILAAPIAVTALFSVFGVVLVSRKKVKFAGSRKLFPWFGGTLLCGILLFSVIFVAVPIVNASQTIPNSVARIYAALDGGQGSPAQLPEEKAAAKWLGGQLEDAFEASGYTAWNRTGVFSNKGNILAYTEYDQENYDRVSVFHFGHMVDYNIGYVDNVGNPIMDSDIAGVVDTNKFDFVFIWVCTQALDPDYGMPEAWTHRNDDLSDDGYLHPDYGDQCYISFDGFSPQIGNESGTFQDQTTGPLKNFIKLFYDYALRGSRRVKDALNLATHDFFGDWYTSSILYGEEGDRYHAWWSGTPPDYEDKGYWEGYMRVFGDGTILVFQPKITLAANHGLSPTFYLDGEPHSTGDIYVWPTKFYTITVSDVPGYVFDHFSYDGGTWGPEPSLQLPHSGAFTAHYSPIQYFALSISAGSGGTTSPEPGDHWYVEGFPAQVTANPNSGYSFSHWLLDGNTYYQNPITVTMNSDHTLKPIFIYDPVEYCLTIQSWYGGYTDPPAGKYYYTVGTNVEVTAYVANPDWKWDHWLLDGNTYYQNPITVTMNSDHTLKPFFDYDPQIEYHDLTLVYMAWYWGWIYLGGGTSSLPEDYYTFTAPSTVYGLDFVCWNYEGYYYYDQTITIFLDSDQYLAAIYVPS